MVMFELELAWALSELFISGAVNLNITSNFYQGRGKVNKVVLYNA